MKRINSSKAQISEQNQTIFDLENRLSSLIHDLKNPTAIIRGYLELLRDEEFGTLSAEIKEVLQKLITKTSEINNILEKDIIPANNANEVDMSAELL